MTTDYPDNPMERLVPEVKNYVTDRFSLWEDLDHLHKVRCVGATAAVILYSARILEVLAADALASVEQRARPTVLANLDALQQFNLIQTSTLYWAHTLRRLGNLVRHIRRRVNPEDAELSLLFVERWLEWFFCRYRYRRPPLRSLTPDARPFALTSGGELRALMEKLDAEEFDPRVLTEQTPEKWSPEFLKTPALPAVVAEMLLGRKHHDEAAVVLEAALKAFSDDLRLNQLRVLHLSRTDQLESARTCLEQPFWDRYQNEEETLGITAGVWKRLWQANRSKPEWLAKSHHLYKHGWNGSKYTNAYLGINVATTALWSGRPAEARQVAEQVRQILQRRAAALAGNPNHPDLALNYWDQVTLAEAEVLLGEFAAARVSYRKASTAYLEQRDNIDVSRRQLDEILDALGLSDTAATFLAALPQPPGHAI
jgi:hypothetical protein